MQTCQNPDRFPDGTLIDPWFSDESLPDECIHGRQYILSDYGILPDGTLKTAPLQHLIDQVATEGGGIIIFPEGEYLSGALYMRQGVHLHLNAGAILKGSDRIQDYPLCDTRIEGQSCIYFPALINAIGLNGFTMTGKGCIDGNGLTFWQAFWLRLKWNPRCTNKDEQRPRLVFLSGCTNVTVRGLTFRNAAFWTNHLYKCQRVRYLNCRMLSPHEPVGAPSTDAIDIDACTDVLIRNCYMAVNDDAVALKGGKGPWADTAPENGPNERILIENCEFGFCHGCLTLGSESIHDRNIILRNIRVTSGYNLLWLKFRPDTHQHYEHILVDHVEGKCANFLNINPWSQFFDLQGRTDLPRSLGEQITIQACTFECDTFFNVRADTTHYLLRDFTLKDLTILAANTAFEPETIEGMHTERLHIRKKDTIDFPDSVTTLSEDNSVEHK